MLFKEVICSHLTSIYFTPAVCNMSGIIPLLGRHTTVRPQPKSHVYMLYIHMSVYIYISYMDSLMAQWYRICQQCKRHRFNPWVGKIKEMVTYSSILAWEIPWTEEPGRLQSVGLQKNQARLSTHDIVYIC